MTVFFKESYMQWETFNVQHSGRIFQLPAWLPDPCFIVGCDFLIEGISVDPSGGGKPILLHDPGGVWTAASFTPQVPNQATELPPSAPLSNRRLMRVACLDTSQARHVYYKHDIPIRSSRSEGDLLNLDQVGLPPAAWFCTSIEYLNAASIGMAQPPAFAFGLGTQAYNTAGVGGRTVTPNYNGSMFGFSFIAPLAGEISNCKFRAQNVTTRGLVFAQLYSDNSGKPGVPIGSPSWPLFIGMMGDWEPQWPIGNGGVMQAGTRYWVVVQAVVTVNVDIDTCPSVSGYFSGRADVATNISNNLPNGESWRFQVCAITPF
jgi:hypothetical protein